MEIGQKLKQKRTAAGYSQEELARKLGVSRQTISNWETNRSYPDIGSIFKLSDLYHLSLDELLKEDAAMRKHTEQAAALTTRYWNLLFEIAILLLPFGSLVSHWGLGVAGLVMRLVGLLLLPPLWYARYKLYGMPLGDLKKSITGWCLYLAGTALAMFGPPTALLGNSMSIIGLLLIYGNGIYLERGKRFYLVIFLYIGIPLYIFGSTISSGLSSTGAFHPNNPFVGRDYGVAQVLYGEAPEEYPLITLGQTSNAMSMDEKRIGKFYYVKPIGAQAETLSESWHLAPESPDNALYKLEAHVSGELTLSYLVDDQLQWRWLLQKLPGVKIGLRKEQIRVVYTPDWHHSGSWDGNMASLVQGYCDEPCTPYLLLSENSIDEMTVVEEYYRNGQMEQRTFTVRRDKNDEFPFPDVLTSLDPTEEGYVLYRIPYAGGEYLFCLELSDSSETAGE